MSKTVSFGGEEMRCIGWCYLGEGVCEGRKGDVYTIGEALERLGVLKAMYMQYFTRIDDILKLKNFATSEKFLRNLFQFQLYSTSLPQPQQKHKWPNQIPKCLQIDDKSPSRNPSPTRSISATSSAQTRTLFHPSRRMRYLTPQREIGMCIHITEDGKAHLIFSSHSAQALMNQLLTATEIRNNPDGPAWILPPPTTPLPREKPLPKPKEPTKWEKYATKKGIAPKRKDGKMVYDEDKGEWVPKWGYKGKNKDGEEDWLVEVDEKKEAREGVEGDVRREKRTDRKERIRRQERKMRANERRAGKGGAGG